MTTVIYEIHAILKSTVAPEFVNPRHEAALRDQLAHKFAVADTHVRKGVYGRRRVRIRQLSYAGAAAVVAVGAVIVAMVLAGPSVSGIAFADVLEQIRNFRPHVYTSTTQYEGKPAYSRRVMRLSLSRRREIWHDGRILVFDLSQEPISILTLIPEQKVAIEKTLLGKGPSRDFDLLKMISVMHEGAAEDLGRVDGL